MARTKREIGGRGERQSREGEKNEFVIEEGNRTPIFQGNPVVATGTDKSWFGTRFKLAFSEGGQR